ncbi:MAG: DNA polymerase III subunit [Candidatus Metalachnospira sp.]|nr:DNA polymerase III subunit [Candidatus Metalachnospira sp.]
MYNFKEIAGNEQIIKSIKSAVRNRMVSHAYIISGDFGSGKKLISGAFAKTLLCEAEEDKPCDECTSCRTFDGGNNPDVIYVYPSKTKALSVDDVREQITSNVNIKPYNHRYKVYIIPNADTLTTQAQNALLKTLEEPPEYAVFMLLTENINAFLPTVLSRCVVFTIKPLPTDKVENYLLENRNIFGEEADIFAEYSQGSIGKAIKYAGTEEFVEMRKIVIDTLFNIKSTQYYMLTDAAKELEAYKDISDVMDMIYMWYRDVLVYKTTGKKEDIIESDLANNIADEAKSCSYEGLCKIPALIINTKKQIKQNVNFVFAMEMLFINIKGELSDDRSSRS